MDSHTTCPGFKTRYTFFRASDIFPSHSPDWPLSITLRVSERGQSELPKSRFGMLAVASYHEATASIPSFHSGR